MRYTLFIAMVSLLAPLTGCTHTQLARNVVTQANTITDIHYRQVLNNLASAEHNPDVLPAFAVVGSGGTLIIDGVGGSAGISFDDRTNLAGTNFGVSGSRAFEDGWTLAPIVDPDKLRAMRAVFQLATRGEISDPRDAHLLDSYLGPDDRNAIKQDWFVAGKQAPKGACYSASCGDTCVWVMPEGLGGLSRLTLAILNIATLDIDAGSAQAQKQVQKYNYQDGVLQSIETYSVPDPGAIRPPVRENFYDPQQAQILLHGKR